MFMKIKDKVEDIYMGQETLKSPSRFEKESNRNSSNKKYRVGTSMVVQWWRIRLPMHGTRVRALVGEDTTCCRATRPVCHNY